MSSRQERSTRSNGRQDSNTAADAALSSPADSSDGEEQSERELRRTRSQKRDQDSQPGLKQPNDHGGSDKETEEDVTRCICRQAEYPGPPHGNERGFMDGAFFIQCEKCNVWQHAGCVGFFDEDACPRHYYCESCRNDLHKIMVGKQGFPYSQYGRFNGVGAVAVGGSHRSSTKEPEGRSSKEADAKNSAASNLLATAKRRATMNSRAAYDDEEVLRIIEESKGNGAAVESTNGSRKSKRTRDESEESEHEQKRQKTRSESESPLEDDAVGADAESDGESSKLRNRTGQAVKRSRTTPQADKDPRRREKEREQERLDPGARRKGRSERRRGDEPDPSDESGKATSPSKGLNPSARNLKAATIGKPAPMNSALAAPAQSNKRSSKASTRRGKVGRNQYTKERDALVDNRSEARPTHSRDGEEGNGSSDGQGALLPNGSKPARPKYMNPNRTSMNELRKRAAGILEFISRTQIEMAGEKGPSEGNTPPPSSAGTAVRSKPFSNGTSKLSNEIRHEAAEGDRGGGEEKKEVPVTNAAAGGAKIEDDEFKALNTLQMMDVLSREIWHWEQVHGKYGERTEKA